MERLSRFGIIDAVVVATDRFRSTSIEDAQRELRWEVRGNELHLWYAYCIYRYVWTHEHGLDGLSFDGQTLRLGCGCEVEVGEIVTESYERVTG